MSTDINVEWLLSVLASAEAPSGPMLLQLTSSAFGLQGARKVETSSNNPRATKMLSKGGREGTGK